ncbi:hypothetical protein DBR06_SOUSAS47410005, partial [Sousa chinensis]
SPKWNKQGDKNLNMENVPQEKKEKEKEGGDPAPVENGEEARPVGG